MIQDTKGQIQYDSIYVRPFRFVKFVDRKEKDSCQGMEEEGMKVHYFIEFQTRKIKMFWTWMMLIHKSI